MNNKLYCINSNTKYYEEVKTIYGIDIEEIIDLIRDYKVSKDLHFDKFGKLEEIEILNKALLDIKNKLIIKINKDLNEDDYELDYNDLFELLDIVNKALGDNK